MTGRPSKDTVSRRAGFPKAWGERQEIIAKTAPQDLFAGMNGLERSFALKLEAMKRSGEILQWEYERVTLKLAHDTRYTPDFFVVECDTTISFYETKGHMRDDARVKLYSAAATFPFRFFLVEKDLTPQPVKRP